MTLTFETSEEGASDYRKQFNYPLVKSTDMTNELRTEAIETIVTALEKYPNNYETAAKWVKETMDKKFGPNWHCIVGEGFGFNITYEVKHMMYLFFSTQAILLFKAAS